MSGIAKGIGKVFKAVGRFVKKVLPVALLVGAALVTGGAAAGLAAPAAAAGAGAAGAGAAAAGSGIAASAFLPTAASLGTIGTGLGSFGAAAPAALAGGAGFATAGAAAAGGGLGSWISGLLSPAGLKTAAGKVLSSPVAGKVLGGMATGWMEGKRLEDEEKAQIRYEKRRMARYAGAGDAGSYSDEDAGRRLTDTRQGLGPAGEASAIPPAEDPSLAYDLAQDMSQPSGPGEWRAQQQTGLGRPPRPSVREQPADQPRRPRYRYNPDTGRIDYT